MAIYDDWRVCVYRHHPHASLWLSLLVPDVSWLGLVPEGAAEQLWLLGLDGSWSRLDTGSGELFGSLLLPQSAKPVPVVLIIAGSGPTDRNGNSAGYLPLVRSVIG